MRFLGTFIGVNKHQDQRVADLTGATRDATALWALFSDTMIDIQAELLLDQKATAEKIRDVLAMTLANAENDDIVVLTFSGHGTRSHRLVTYDTIPESLHTSTISMEELTEQFKSSKAKIILCILDCCFSGGAPAKVLEDTPRPRNPEDPYQILAGKGRIIIAASSSNEPAYERPGTGHGLLTKAIIDTFQKPAGQVRVTEAFSDVMQIVQAEAMRIGVTQTPVILSYVEGGLTMPALKPGEHYYKAFPQKTGIKVTRNIPDLAGFDLPENVIAEWEGRFKNGLNPLQLEAVNEYRVLDGESLLVIAPTTSGKTFIGEMAAVRSVVDGRKAVFLLPYRALVNEKYYQFSQSYGEKLNMQVIRCTGDYSDHTSFFARGKYDLAVLTFEMFLNLVISNPHVLNQIGLIVLDEAQFITDPTRGITVELLLTYLLLVKEKGITPQLVALSAVIGNRNSFDEWLGLRCLFSDHRPVPLTEGVIDRSGRFLFLDQTGQPGQEQLLPSNLIRIRKDKPSAQDVIVPLVQKLVAQGEKVIVFRNQRGPAQGCAKYLAADLGLPAADDFISELPNHDRSTTTAALLQALQGGTAFHNSNLTRDEREVVEKAFRDPNSKVRVLAATTTVAAGINTPASTVIIAEQEFLGEDGRPFTVAEYKNMAGRAGRLGFNEKGKCIILAETPYDQTRLFEKYVMGHVESIQSSFDSNCLDTWLVRLLAQVKQIKRDDVIRLLANTYGGYLQIRANPEWQKLMAQDLNRLVTRMLQLGLLEQDQSFIQLTLLGKACGNSSLSFESSLRLVELLRELQSDRLTPENLLAIVQVLPESDEVYTPLMKRGSAENIRIPQAASRYGSEVVQMLQRFASEHIVYLGRCKRAAILFDWVNGVSIEQIEKTFSTNPFQGAIQQGDIRRFADSARFHMRSAYQIAVIVRAGDVSVDQDFDAFLRQLEVGIPGNSLQLLLLPVPLSRGEYLALLRKGVTDVNSFWNLPKPELNALLDQMRLETVEKLRPIAAIPKR